MRSGRRRPARPSPTASARRGTPAPRSGWPAPSSAREAHRAGDWRGRSAAPAARRPSARRCWITRSTSPQSMPRSRVEVQTTAAQIAPRHRRFDLAPLRRRRASRDAARSARSSSLMRHSSWNSISAWLRVLTKTSAVLLRLDRGRRLRHGVARLWPAHGNRSRVRAFDDRRRGAAGADDVGGFDASPSRCGTRKRASSSGSATVADRPTRRMPGRQRATAAPAPSASRSPRLDGRQRMQFVEDHALSDRRRTGAARRRRQQQRQLLRRGQQDVRRIAPLPLRAATPACRRCGSRRVIGRPISAIGRFQIARDVDRQRLQRRDVEGVQAARCAPSAALRASASPARGQGYSAPPASAKIRPASCRRRSARSAAPSGRRGPLPAAPAGVRAATIRGLRTSAQRRRATG